MHLRLVSLHITKLPVRSTDKHSNVIISNLKALECNINDSDTDWGGKFPRPPRWGWMRKLLDINQNSLFFNNFVTNITYKDMYHRRSKPSVNQSTYLTFKDKYLAVNFIFVCAASRRQTIQLWNSLWADSEVVITIYVCTSHSHCSWSIVTK